MHLSGLYKNVLRNIEKKRDAMDKALKETGLRLSGVHIVNQDGSGITQEQRDSLKAIYNKHLEANHGIH